MRITEQTWPEGTVPVVSVFSWSYNHVDFIRQSIDSILMQETTFPVEIIIHDDASTDGTTEIIREYESKHPQLFRNIIQKENQWSQGKSVMDPMFTAPRGEFIALTHGDDFWTDPMKLTKQVHLLESDPKIHLCFHPVDITGDCRPVDYPFHPPRKLWKSEWETEDLFQGNNIPTCAVMLPRKTCPHLPPRFDGLAMADWPMWFFVSLSGTIVCINEVMGTYRIHKGGTWSGKMLYAQMAAELAMWKVLKRDIKKPLHPILWKRRMLCYEVMFSNAESVSRFKLAYLLYCWLVCKWMLRELNGSQIRYVFGRIFPVLPKLLNAVRFEKAKP